MSVQTQVTCPSCSTSFKAKAELAGRRVKCPKCHKRFNGLWCVQNGLYTHLNHKSPACKAYVDAVCKCTAPAAVEACSLAKALPEALQVATEISMSTDSKRLDVLQANDSARKTIASCIEKTAKLPSLGC